MRGETGNAACYCTVGSVTLTMRAQGVLRSASIRSQVVSADADHAAKGCAYALSYPCAQQALVRHVLENAGIQVRSFYRGERGYDLF